MSVPNELQRWTHRRAGQPVWGRDVAISGVRDERQDWSAPLSRAGILTRMDYALQVTRGGVRPRPLSHHSIARAFSLLGAAHRRLARVPLLPTVRLAATHFNSAQHVSYHTPDAAKVSHVERRPRCSVAMPEHRTSRGQAIGYRRQNGAA